MRWLLRTCAPALFLMASSAALAQQALIVAAESTSAKAFRPQVGRVLTFVCPSNLKPSGDIWGTIVYLDESPICTAAMHAGVLTPGTSGQVTIVMREHSGSGMSLDLLPEQGGARGCIINFCGQLVPSNAWLTLSSSSSSFLLVVPVP